MAVVTPDLHIHMWLSVFIIKLVVDVRQMKGGIKRYFGKKLCYPEQLQHSQTLHTFSDILVFVSIFVFVVVPVFVIIFDMISITFCDILRGF